MRCSSCSRKIVLGVFAVLFACAAFAQAQGAPTLKVGDPAPPLVADKWIKGGPVEKLEKGKIYVVEFWATWCGPCVRAIPHVTRLQKKYADQDVVVIGMNVWERDRSSLEPFMRKMADKIGYALATDLVAEGAAAGRMAETWMKAAGINGIPTSFIVDREGRIAWIGHAWRMERPLRLIAAGTFDAAVEAEVEKRRLAKEAALVQALAEHRLDEALVFADRLIALNEGALTTPTTDGAEPYGVLKLKVLVAKGDYAAANALASRLAEVLPELAADDSASVLQPILRVMAWAPDLKQLDTDLMLRLAKQVADQAPKENWKASRLLARVHAARGEYDRAVVAQRRALAAAPVHSKRWEQDRLNTYQEKAAAASSQGMGEDAGR